MLKGDVFKNQIFENQIFALFINLFMNKADGVARSYKNAMNITYSGHNLTVDQGACVVQGRFLEEDSSTTIDAGIETMFCKLVVEVDLDKVNTSDVFNQGYYNVVKSASGYPALTQQDIAGQNSGKYQYELARFKISDGVVTDFQDMRTYIEDLLQYGGLDILNNRVTQVYNTLNNNKISKTTFVTTANTDLNDYKDEGTYYFETGFVPTNIPAGANGYLQVFNRGQDKAFVKQIWYRQGTPGANDMETYVRTYGTNGWGTWTKYTTMKDFAILTGLAVFTTTTVQYGVAYPSGFNSNNCVLISFASDGNVNEPRIPCSFSE